MNCNIVVFPKTRAANTNASRLPQAAANIISLDRFRDAARTHRTANGVFFMTNVLTTPGDFA